jgi:predicted ATPase/class 3 adenylate cyclase
VGGTAETVFCFTDIEGSTALLRNVGEAAYEVLLERHRELIRGALADAGGEEIKTEGDGFFLAFAHRSGAVAFAAAAQRGLGAEPWPTAVRVRMGMHVGPAERRADGDYVALAVHQAARVAAVAHGGQVLVTDDVVADVALPPATHLQRLGAYRLRDFDGPVELSQLAGAGIADAFPPLRAARADHGLRLPRSSLVGRDRELDELSRLLVTYRLVTLSGTGGVGKTRLALEAAAAAAAVFVDGLHVAELSQVTGPQFVDATLAAAVGVRPEPGIESLDAVVAAVAAGKHLVVLDSCEHCLDGVANAVDELLRACPNVVLLATTTEPIRLPDERLVHVEPLALADPTDEGYGPAGASALASDAVRLLVQRATQAGAAIGGTDAELAQAADIARRLDGIPLALELAAGRIAERGLAAVQAALDDRFSLLTNGYRTALPRHRTLEAMVAWSVEQLKPEVADLLVRLSALLGRWEPAAAAAVCSDDPAAPAWLEVLIDRSLVAVEEGPPQRVRLLDTVRAFAGRSLAEAEHIEIAARRAQWMAGRLADLGGAHEDEYIAFIDAVIPDVRSVLARGHGEDVATATAVAGGVTGWYEQRGLWLEAIGLLEALIAECPPGAERAMAMAGLAQLASMAGRQQQAAALLERVLVEPDATPRAKALALLAGTPLGYAPPADAQDPLELALELSVPGEPTALGARARIALRKQMLGDAQGAADDLVAIAADANAIGRVTLAAQAHMNLGGVYARLGRLEDAERALEVGRSLAEERRNRAIAAGALTNLSLVALLRGDAKRALDLAEQRLTLAREMVQPRGEAAALSAVSAAAAALGDTARARDAANQTLQLCRRLDLPEGVATAGFNLVVMASRADDWRAAAQHASDVIADVAGLGNPSLSCLALYAAGGVLAASGRTVGVELMATAEATAPGQVPLDPTDLEWLHACAAVIGADDAATARARGATNDAATALKTAAAELAALLA